MKYGCQNISTNLRCIVGCGKSEAKQGPDLLACFCEKLLQWPVLASHFKKCDNETNSIMMESMEKGPGNTDLEMSRCGNGRAIFRPGKSFLKVLLAIGMSLSSRENWPLGTPGLCVFDIDDQ